MRATAAMTETMTAIITRIAIAVAMMLVIMTINVVTRINLGMLERRTTIAETVAILRVSCGRRKVERKEGQKIIKDRGVGWDVREEQQVEGGRSKE